MMSIRETLCRAARRITDRALAEYTEEAAWRRLVPEKRRQFLEMMGLEDLPAPAGRMPVPIIQTGVLQRPGYRIEKLALETRPQLYVTANLYVPDPGTPGATGGLRPAVLYLCGHSEKQKVAFQAHPRRFAELGFVCLLMETIQLGEGKGYHHGTYREGWWHWISRGYTPAGVELYNALRAIDYLCQRPEVDPGRLCVTGISGGGASTWYLAAADERIGAAAPVCGTTTLASHVQDRVIDGHCDCMWWVNTYLWDLADVGGLIAPRPLLIASADRDEIFPIASIREVHGQLQRLYTLLGAPQNLRLVETPGGHSYHERSRKAIFAFFLQHLQQRIVPENDIGDVDETPDRQEPEAVLRVFVNGPPDGDRTPSIQDSFIPLARPPQIADRTDLTRVRQRVTDALRSRTFRAFPPDLPALDLRVEFEFRSGDRNGFRFAFTPEEGWRLHGECRLPAHTDTPLPAVIALRSPEEERGATERYVRTVRAPWAQVIIETRGTGDTAWGQSLQWHLRRASAWTGRTLASMRVWDTLCAMTAVRSLPQIADRPLVLAAQGEMAAVALYAALLDGRVAALLLQSPPATQNAPSQPDGRGETIEMLNCLQITDLPQVAGLLFPAEIVVTGTLPETYHWARDLYRTLGSPDRFQHLPDLTGWTPRLPDPIP
ncbi:MAG: prolyl oligopeptidase family serine peptidase [Chloroherpetonaceae bacterium]|nr:acetylxylan esterase [Chthonomonadaceae bacterium]MDW8206399.1 prolyl oligopeptidase family serine peptidase [Chloroherpetonaceae bacterium]